MFNEQGFLNLKNPVCAISRRRYSDTQIREALHGSACTARKVLATLSCNWIFFIDSRCKVVSTCYRYEFEIGARSPLKLYRLHLSGTKH